MIVRRTGFHSKTVEIPISELPPPPNPIERLRDSLKEAARWASDVGPEMADKIANLLVSSELREGAKEKA